MLDWPCNNNNTCKCLFDALVVIDDLAHILGRVLQELFQDGVCGREFGRERHLFVFAEKKEIERKGSAS